MAAKRAQVTLEAVRTECLRRWRVATGREWTEDEARRFRVLPEFDPPEERPVVLEARRRAELALDVLARAARRLQATRDELVEELDEDDQADAKVDVLDELLEALPPELLEATPTWRRDRTEAPRSRFVRRLLDTELAEDFASRPALLAVVLVLGGHVPVNNKADTLQAVLRREADSVRKAIAYYSRRARIRR